MSVIVNGMRLPGCCAECELSESDEEGIFCNVLEVFMRFDELPKGRRYDCPIFDENVETLQSIVINDRYGNVAEYAKVIRCKDCKLNPKRMRLGCPMAHCLDRTDEWYCPVAKPKESHE